jgi:Flp pilus assembly protein TadD
MGNEQGRLAFWGAATGAQPDNGIFRYHLGLAREAVGEDEGALGEYRRVLAESPDTTESLYSAKNMDGILTRRNDPAARVGEWRRMAEARPNVSLAQYHLGMALEDADDANGAEEAYREALRLRPEKQEPKVGLGAVLAVNGDAEGGLRLVDEAVAAMPDLSGPAAEACGRAAKARLSSGDMPGALALSRRARSLSPADLRYCVALGEALEAAGKDEDALGEYQKVLAESPEAPEALYCAKNMDGLLTRRNNPAFRVTEWRRLVELRPDAVLPQLYLGMALENGGDIGGAEAAYREVLRLRPEKPEPKVRLGAVIAVKGDIEGGLQLVDEAVGATPDVSGVAAEACRHAAKARLSAGDTPGAVTLLRRARSLSPSDLRYCVALGEAFEAAGEDENALAEYRGVLAKSPESPESLCCTKNMEDILIRRNDPAARVAEWRRMVEARPEAALAQLHLGMALEDAGDGGDAETAYREALRLRPERQEPKLRLGAVLGGRGDVEGCLRLMDEAVGITPDLSGPAAEACVIAAKARLSARDARGATALLRRARILAPTDLRCCVALGEALEAAGEGDGALAEYRAVVAKSPESPESLICGRNMDEILIRRNDPAARVAEWRSMTEAHPDAALPQLYLGMALEDAGDGGGAEAAYREALRLRPERQAPKVRIGAVLAAKGDVEGGLRLVDEAAAAAPDLSGPAAEACGRAAKARLSAGDTPAALALLQRARSLSPTDLRYRVALGGALEAAGDDDGALAEYRAVVAEMPESPHSSDQIDAILLRRKDLPGRVAEWRGAVERHPDAAVPHMHLGLALEVLGDLPGARAAYGRALEIDPKLADARDALERINGNAVGSK